MFSIFFPPHQSSWRYVKYILFLCILPKGLWILSFSGLDNRNRNYSWHCVGAGHCYLHSFQVILSLPWIVSLCTRVLESVPPPPPQPESLLCAASPLPYCVLWTSAIMVFPDSQLLLLSSESPPCFAMVTPILWYSLETLKPVRWDNRPQGAFPQVLRSAQAHWPLPLHCLLIGLTGSRDSWPRNKSKIFAFHSAFGWKLVI